MTTGDRQAPPSGSTRGAFRRFPAASLIACVRFYQSYISPYRLPTCRFAPTCSEYAVDALRAHGAAKGFLLAVVRLVKCGPWHRGGWDPVPERTCTKLREEDHLTVVGDEKRSA